jgi:mono/diheme cytochrome c family protein
MKGSSIRHACVAVLAVFGCNASGVGPAERQAAYQVWNSRCVNCHGPTGMGDGPQARNLEVSPRRLNDKMWQTKVSDEHIAKVIVEGGASVGKSALMAANPDLADKPRVVQALVQIVREL